MKNETNITEVKSEKSRSSVLIIVAVCCIVLAIALLVVGVLLFTDKDDTKKKSNNNASSTLVSALAENDDVSSNNANEKPSKKDDNKNSSDKITATETESNGTPSTDNTSSSNKTSQNKIGTSSTKDEGPKSTTPTVTSVAQMANNIFVITGTCSTDTEMIVVSGKGITTTEITPVKGKSKNSFFGQVNVTSKEYLVTFSVQAKEKDLPLSEIATKTGIKEDIKENLMMLHEYTPFFGTKGRIHYYSALLSYSLSNVIDSNLKAQGITHISKVVNAAKSANPNSEVIFLVAPSSAEVYPETIPLGFEKASGETVFSAFNTAATSAGAKVIYPIDTMKAHKNDGDGYKIYHNTDSHWSTYGSYWAVSDLMNYISAKYPAAKPRTLSEMEFYTVELCGGDAFFTYTDRGILETKRGNGITSVTKIKELTTLFKKAMPTNTINTSFKGGVGVDIFNTPVVDKEQTINNPNGSNLPTAMIVRDSFGVTPFDIINDRFSKVWWSSNGDIAYKDKFFTKLNENKPDYVIYIISERNLAKILGNNVGLSLVGFVK